MAYEDILMGYMLKLSVANKHDIAELVDEYWTEGVSRTNNVYKALSKNVAMGRLVKGDGYFKLPDCKSEYKEHARLLTKALVEILKLKLETKIHREHTIPEIGLRPDSIVLLTKEDKNLCFILEVVNNETEEYLRQKVHALRHWEGALDYLSSLFNIKIPAFDIVVAGSVIENTFEFNSYLKEAIT